MKEAAFSFVGKTSLSREEVQDIISSGTEGMEAGSTVVKALRWGIGLHHAGLQHKYKQMVEVLFRAKHIRVVFATG